MERHLAPPIPQPHHLRQQSKGGSSPTRSSVPLEQVLCAGASGKAECSPVIKAWILMCEYREATCRLIYFVA